MSAKNSNKKQNARKGTRIALWVVIGVLIAVLVLLLLLWWGLYNTQDTGDTPSETNEPIPGVSETVGQSDEQPQSDIVFEEVEDISINLGYGLAIAEVGKYTGAYVEDGSDEFVTGVLMLRVTNTGTQDIQYAEIAMALAEGEAKFSLSTLPVGKSVILLEQNRLAWDAEEAYAYALTSNVVAFNEPVSLHADQLQIQMLEGGLNVTNISGEDITGDIVIYYKNAQQDLYYGGITYRVRLEGGLPAGQLQQIMTEHLSASGSEIVFVTID